MAYTVDGKIFTDHALMDEIVFAVKKIFKDIIIKNDFLADQLESQLSVDNFDIEKLKRQNNVTFDNFPFTAVYYKAYGLSSTLVDACVESRYAMPEEMREDFLAFCLDFYNQNFEEVNDYYRTLAGLPPYNTGNQYFITYDGKDDKVGYGYFIPTYFKNLDTVNIDPTLPLHLQTTTLIEVLQSTGGIDALRDIYKGSKYEYISHLGNKALDWYTARIASKYDILYMPTVERLVEDRFKELYYINRDIYLTRTYQDAYSYESEYFEQEVILMILCQTFADIITETPEWYIRRDIFDLRSVQYFLESYGVEYFPEIPLKYQIRIVKNLNKLIKYKSSNRNNEDILKIFDMPDAKLFKYYLFKRRRLDGENYIHSSVNNKDFKLEFIKSEYSDTYDNYIKNNLYQVPYNDITLEDKYWDGETDHNVLRNKILKKDFTIEGTKYMSIEYAAPQSDYIDQMQFFLGTVLNSNFNMSDFTVIIPSISETAQLAVSDLFLLAIALSDIYEATEQALTYPDNTIDPWDVDVDEDYKRFYTDLDGGYADSPDNLYDRTVNGNIEFINTTASWWITGDGGRVEYSTIKSAEELNNWMKYWYNPKHNGHEDDIRPWMYETRKNYICGFNDVDLDKLQDIISQRHSRYGFEKGYTLEELGVDGYISPSDITIHNAEELMAFYKNNITIYNQLKERLTGRYYNFAEDKEDVVNSLGYDEHKLIEFVFNTLFTREFDYDYYKLDNGEYASNFGDILVQHNYIIYDVYNKIRNDTNKETQQDYIRTILNDIITTLEYYINGDEYKYIFSFTSIASFDSLLRYIYLMINFFKSWKVHFIDPYVTFQVSDIVQNNAAGYDAIREIQEEVHKTDKLYTADAIAVSDEQWISDNAGLDIKESLGVSVHYDPDPLDDYDYDGMKPENDGDDYKDADGAYPDDNSQIPYRMLNGGNPQLGMFGDWDLNGYGPKDLDQDYLDIDGGYPYDEDEDRTDWMGTLGFNYIVDGGDVAFSNFIGQTMRMDLHNHQVYADVKVSHKMYNVLKVKKDGLYIENDWVSLNEFLEFVDDLTDDYNYYSDLYSYLLTLIEEVYDEEKLDETISNIVDKYTKTIIDTADDLIDDDAKDKIKNYVDGLVEEIFDRYKDFTALGTWGTIEDSEVETT